MDKKYELPEDRAGIVSEPVAAYDYADVQRPTMHVSHSDELELTEDQVRKILEMGDSAAAHGIVYSHEEVMDRLNL